MEFQGRAAALITGVVIAAGSAVAAPLPTTYLDFTTVAPGTSVAGFGAVSPFVDIEDPGSTPIAFGVNTPGGNLNLFGANKCAPYSTNPFPCFGASTAAVFQGYTSPTGGLGDLLSEGGSTSPNAPAFGPNDFTFQLAPGYTANSFTIRMLDEGDNNPWWATLGTVTVSGYTANGGNLVAFETVTYIIDTTSPRVNTDFSVGSFSVDGNNFTSINPQNDADASAPSGSLGNFVFAISGSNMSYFTIAWSNNGNGLSGIGTTVPVNTAAPLDPKVGFTDVAFNVPVREPPSVALFATAVGLLISWRRRRPVPTSRSAAIR